MKFVLENHSEPCELMPIIFYCDSIEMGRSRPTLHWHENLEIICVDTGAMVVTSDLLQIPAEVHDIIVVNSNSIHSFSAPNETCTYHYLIIDKAFARSFGMDFSNTRFDFKFNDAQIVSLFNEISLEIEAAAPLYQAAVKSAVIRIVTLLARAHTIEENAAKTESSAMRRVEVVKAAVAYINKNFAHALTIEDISASVGFSKYYLCRMFKELTGQTVFEYLNFVRCVRAKLLLGTGEYNVSQVAELCGFSNLSYFTKQYKRNVGTLPSKEKASSPKT